MGEEAKNAGERDVLEKVKLLGREFKNLGMTGAELCVVVADLLQVVNQAQAALPKRTG